MKRRDFLSLSSLLLLGFSTQGLASSFGANSAPLSNQAFANQALANQALAPTLIPTGGAKGGIPNSPLPLLLYRAIIPSTVQDKADYLESLFAQNSWQSAWRYQIFPYHHFHSTAHECVACFSGRARLQVGGEGGRVLEVGIGDVLVIPAGVGHRQVDSSGGFCMVGAYPIGQRADVCRDDLAYLAKAQERIAQVPLPRSDPINGRVINAWG